MKTSKHRQHKGKQSKRRTKPQGSWLDRAKAACRRIVMDAELKKQPMPTITFLLDDDAVDIGPIVFPTLPRKGDFIKPEVLGEKREVFFAYEVIGVTHEEANHIFCDIPHVVLWVTKNNDYLTIILRQSRED